MLTTSLSEFLGRKTPRQLQRIIRFLAFSAFYVSHDCFQAKQWENVQCVHWIPETHHRCCEWPWNWWDFVTGALEQWLGKLKIKMASNPRLWHNSSSSLWYNPCLLHRHFPHAFCQVEYIVRELQFVDEITWNPQTWCWTWRGGFCQLWKVPINPKDQF